MPHGRSHQEEDYPEAGFESLERIQESHFWYRGRHRFVHYALGRAVANGQLKEPRNIKIIDLGGGCGGWIKFLSNKKLPGVEYEELALGDSSKQALFRAQRQVPANSKLFQIDLLNLGWQERWDVAFLLDVVEHLDEDLGALKQVAQALKPNGLALITVPALKCFWSFADELAGHKRRYTKRQLDEMAAGAGLRPIASRYFMFLLSPLLYASRLRHRTSAHLTDRQKRKLMEDELRLPPSLVNYLLYKIFSAETPTGFLMPFPWGTSLLGVYQKHGNPRAGLV